MSAGKVVDVVRSVAALFLVMLVALCDSANAQTSAQVLYRFQQEPAAVNLDDEGRGRIDYHVFIESAGFACAKPLELKVDVGLLSTHPTWANVTLVSPPRLLILPPGPLHYRSGSAHRGHLDLDWDVAKAATSARETYVLYVARVTAESSGCAPTPTVVRGLPQHFNATACLKPQVGGYGLDCKDLKPMGLGIRGERAAPGPQIGLALAALVAVIALRSIPKGPR